MTLLLPCDTTKALRVTPRLAVDGLLRLSADAAVVHNRAQCSAAAGWGGAGALLLWFDGRLLRDGGATLAEAGVTEGSRIEVISVAHGGMPAKASPSELSEGCTVEIRGLVSASQHNGREGLLLHFVSEKGRWHVKLAPDGEVLSLKPANLVCIGGPQDEREKLRSLTKANLMGVIREAAELLRLGGYSGKVTSHALQGLFQNATEKDKDGNVLRSYPKHVVKAPFHPKDRWKSSYSTRLPTIVVTYTWYMDLLNELPEFIAEAEKMLRLTEDEAERVTWWLDIWFNDQTKPEGKMHVVLDEAKRVYLKAEYHMVFLLNGVFKRGWCLAELAYRIQVPRLLIQLAEFNSRSVQLERLSSCPSALSSNAEITVYFLKNMIHS